MSNCERGAHDGRLSIAVRVGLLFAVQCVACTQEPLVYPAQPSLMPDDTGLDSGVSVQRQLDGDPCDVDGSCESGHCSNHVCCAAGECCRDADDCSMASAKGVCTDATSCLGMAPVATCEAHRCVLKMGRDDRACDAMVESDTCGLYKSVFCNGKQKQTQPKCAATCDSDDACDLGAHCQMGACVANAFAGVPCKTGSECKSGMCVSGLCCDNGNCCTMDSECDEKTYGKPLACDDHPTCQGSSGVPVCQNGRCGTKRVDDDSACDSMTVASDCTDGKKVYCRGGRDQTPPPACASGATCTRDLDCTRSSYCAPGSGLFSSGMCAPDLPNGSHCDHGEMCQSGHCSNSGSASRTASGVCCSYDCSDRSALCPGVDCDSMTMSMSGN